MVFWVVWLEEKIGEILAGPTYFLFTSTKMQSLQFREKIQVILLVVVAPAS